MSNSADKPSVYGVEFSNREYLPREPRLMSSEAVEGQLIDEGGVRPPRRRVVTPYVLHMQRDSDGVFCAAMGFGG